MEPAKIRKLTETSVLRLADGRVIPAVPPPQQETSKEPERRSKGRKGIRKAGDEEWYDPTMEDWPENDYRMYVSDLGPEVSDEGLTRAFRKYPSVTKVRVVKDVKTGKSKGYGFVSFSIAEDYLRAFREMNGRHIGSRPVRLSKSKSNTK
jgi:RNA recognition motif-containing protein